MAKILIPIERKDTEDMVPVEKWDGDCWQAFFEQFCVPNAERTESKNPWDLLAEFVKDVIIGEG